MPLKAVLQRRGGDAVVLLIVKADVGRLADPLGGGLRQKALAGALLEAHLERVVLANRLVDADLRKVFLGDPLAADADRYSDYFHLTNELR